MNNRRTLVVLLVTVLLVSLWGLILLVIYLGTNSIAFFLGIPIGIIFWIVGYMFFADTWFLNHISDIDNMWDSEKARQEKRRKENGEAFILLLLFGGFFAKVFSDVKEGMISDAIIGAMLTFISCLFIYAILRSYKN